jgi:hypothetical protein
MKKCECLVRILRFAIVRRELAELTGWGHSIPRVLRLSQDQAACES